MGKSAFEHQRHIENMRMRNGLESIKDHIPNAVENLENLGLSLKDQFSAVSKVLNSIDTPEEQLAVVEGQLKGLVLLSDNMDKIMQSDHSILKKDAQEVEQNLDIHHQGGALQVMIEIGAKYPDEIPQNLIDNTRDMLERTGLAERMRAQGLSEDEINQAAQNLAGYALTNSDYIQDVKREAGINSTPEVDEDAIDLWSGNIDDDYSVSTEDISMDKALVSDSGDLNTPSQVQSAPQEQKIAPATLQFN